MGDPPTINVSKVLKCKINHNFFSLKNMSFPNRGEGGGGVPTWEKFPHFPVFWGGQRPLQALVSPWAQPRVDFMHVGDGGEVEEDGRIEGMSKAFSGR